MGWKDAPVVEGGAAWMSAPEIGAQQQPAQEQPQRNFFNADPSRALRSLGLTGRAGLSGVGLGGLANIVGLPQPENPTERVVQDVAGTMAGGGAIGAGAKALARGAQGITQPLLNMLAANPGAQAISSAGAGAGGGIARESGAGPMGQFAGELAGGLVAPTSFDAVRSGGQLAHQALHPTVGNIGVRAAGDRSQAVIDALRTEQSNVPGVNLTAGQASVPANSAEFAALQRLVAEKKAPSTYFGPSGIEGQQEAARLGAVRRDIAGTPDKLTEAMKARSLASDANYKEAFEHVVKRDKELRELWKNPYFKDEVGEAWKLMKAEASKRGEKMPLSKNLTQFLQFVKEGLDARLQTLSNPQLPAISKSSKDAVLTAKGKLISWLDARNPAYENARVTHSELSKPINQMKAGQDLERALVAPATEAERAGSFAGAVRRAETTVSKSTGKPRIEDLTPKQRATIDALKADFKRNADYKDLASKGGTNLEERIGAPELPPTGFFQPFVSAARGWVNKALGTGREAALERAAPVMTDPQAMARAMAKEMSKTAHPGMTKDDLYRAALATLLEQGQQQ